MQKLTTLVAGLAVGLCVHATENSVEDPADNKAIVLTSRHAQCLYVDGANGSDENDGSTWKSAVDTIQHAIDLAETGDSIIVTNGVYEPIVSTKDIAIRSVNGPATTIIDGGSTNRCADFRLRGILHSETADVRMEGFTLRNGFVSGSSGYTYDIPESDYDFGFGGGANGGIFSNCWFVACVAGKGGGLVNATAYSCRFESCFCGLEGAGAYGSTLEDCVLTNNTAGSGAAAYASTLSRCRIVGNHAMPTASEYKKYGLVWYRPGNIFGGGTCESTSDNCLYIGNVTDDLGGASYGDTLLNCTLASNVATNSGGGCQNGYIQNCIILQNTSSVSNNICNSTVSFTCSDPQMPGKGNMLADDVFVDLEQSDFRLSATSPCVDAGSTETLWSDQDLAGRPRVRGGFVDMGVYEVQEVTSPGIAVKPLLYGGSVTPMNASVAVGGSITFTLDYNGVHDFLGFSTNGVFATDERTFQWQNITADGVIEALFDKSPATVHTSIVGNDGNSGRSFALAKRTIQSAIEAAYPGDRILVGNGTYASFTTDNKAISIFGVNGPAVTIIDGVGSGRCATLGTYTQRDTFVSGFTFRNGYLSDAYGGGTIGGTVSNCVYTVNKAKYGGGAYGGRILDAVFTGNATSYDKGYGGGTYYADLEGCVVTNNSAYYGGGTYYGTISNTLIVCNTATGGGGGGNGGRLINCRIIGNQAKFGGGLEYATAADSVISNNVTTSIGGGAYHYCYLTRCEIVDNRSGSSGGGTCNCYIEDCLVKGNTAADSGGGVDGFSATNCVIVGNSAVKNGGGSYQTELINCTVVQNDAQGEGGGVYGGELLNTIIALNSAAACSNNASRATLSHCCTSEEADPLFVDAEGGDFHLQSESPCLNAGANSPFDLDDVDYDGRPRIRDGVVDLGAFEQDVEGVAGVYVYVPYGGVVTPMCGTVRNGGELVFSVASPRAFLGYYTNGVFASAEKIFAWRHLQEDGRLEARFDTETPCTIYVDGTNGDDDVGMTEDLPARTIDKALVYACEGDTIMVADGVYDPITIENLRIRIQSINGPETTIIDGQNNKRCATFVPLSAWGWRTAYYTRTVLSGFTLRNGYAEYGVNEDANSNSGGAVTGGTLENCILENNYASYEGGGAFCSVLKNCDIIYNTVGSYCGGGTSCCQLYNCRVMYNSGPYYGGGYANGSAYNCICAFNEATTGGGASWATSRNCTIVNNTASSEAGGVWCGTLYNSIIWGNTAGTSPVEARATLTYCCTDGQEEGTGNITGDPLLKDVANEDFSLQEGSICIDAGNNATVSTSTDFNGNLRIHGSAVDIGAIEYIPVEQPVDENSFENVWGSWSIENDTSFEFPTELNDWDSISRFAWRARDKFSTAANLGCMPPTDKPIVISLGTFSHTGTMTSLSGEDVPMDEEMGVPVWHVRISEDPKDGVFKATIGGVEVQTTSLPSYDANRWVEAMYGTPPTWLSAEEQAEWYASRNRCRIELFMTLVPSEYYTQFDANQSDDEENLSEEDQNKVLLREFLPNVSTNHLHVLNVRTPDDTIVNFLGTSDLSQTNWDFNGIGAFSKGRSSAGVTGEGESYFFKVVTGTGDSDGDGISDVIEEHVYGTDPHKSDTSGGGIPDGEKILRYGLNPKVSDTDGDGYDDDEEIALGQDPKTSTPGAPMTIRYVYDDDDRLTGTYFGNNGRSTTTLSPAGNPLVIEKRGAK